MACCGCAGAQGWFPVGSGANALNANGEIYTMCTDDSGNVYAAGEFSYNDTAMPLTYCVSKWNISTHTWSRLGDGISGGTPLWYGPIRTICVDKYSNVYAAGEFVDSSSTVFQGFNYVAKWNSATGVWNKLGFDSGSLGLNALGVINTICVDSGGNVFAAGNFRDALGYSCVMKWDGMAWSELMGLNANLFINSICLDSSQNLYAGGTFSDGSGHQFIAKWSHATNTWSELGSGVDPDGGFVEIVSVKTDASGRVLVAANVYDTGTTTHVVVGNVYVWNDTVWSLLGGSSGQLNGNKNILSMCIGDSGFVYAAGGFMDSNGESYVAKYSPQTNAWSELGTGINSLNPHSPEYPTDAWIFTLCTDKMNHVFAAGAFTDSISHSNNYFYVAEYGPPSLGTNIVNKANGIAVYPNPAEGSIFIKNGPVGQEYSLYNISGILCAAGVIDGNGESQIGVVNLQPGLYMLSIDNFIFKIFKK